MTSPEASNTIAIQTDWAEDVCDQVTDDLDLEDTPFSLTTDYLQAVSTILYLAVALVIRCYQV